MTSKAATKLKHQIDKFDLADKEINSFIQNEVNTSIQKILDARERMYQDVFKYKNAKSFENNSHVLRLEAEKLRRDLTEMLNLVLERKD